LEQFKGKNKTVPDRLKPGLHTETIKVEKRSGGSDGLARKEKEDFMHPQRD
jgi:hypothetical protein